MNSGIKTYVKHEDISDKPIDKTVLNLLFEFVLFL